MRTKSKFTDLDKLDYNFITLRHGTSDHGVVH